MPSFSSLFTSLTGAGFFYEKSARHATHTFNQDAQSLYRNQPRFPFEYYININLNQVGTAKEYISQYFNSNDLSQIPPLVKTVEMPAMKIDTVPINQYNRKRLSQSKIMFESIKMVFHDVADGKTLKFWDMYYRYYFADGNEPGKNESKVEGKKGPVTFKDFIKNITPTLNPAIASLPASVTNLLNGTAPGKTSATNKNGDKNAIQNIVSDTLDNHNFGFNLPTVGNIRNLIQSIDIYQVHGGRFNQVTLVNPRIAAFTHDTLSYATGDKTLEITFAIEYEYAYYTIQNMKLGNPDNQSNNNSSLKPFSHGEFLELPSLAFNATLNDFIESNNPLLHSDNPILQRIGKNVQSAIVSTTGAFISNNVRRVSASALDGLAQISPKPYVNSAAPAVTARSFASSAKSVSGKYQDMNRTGGNGGKL